MPLRGSGAVHRGPDIFPDVFCYRMQLWPVGEADQGGLLGRVLLQLVGDLRVRRWWSLAPRPSLQEGLDAGEELGPQQKWGAGWRSNDRCSRQS